MITNKHSIIGRITQSLIRLLLPLLMSMISSSVIAASMYVYVPTEMRANAIEKNLNQTCPEIKIKAFGRVKDFHNQVELSTPDAILTLLPTMKSHQAYSLKLHGEKEGSSKEPYIFVSLDKAIDIENLNNVRMGVVDIMGRKPMKAFLNGIFNTKVKLKRVTKQEDLLPLLTFKSVDAIFIPESTFLELSEKTNQNLVRTPLDVQIGLASTAAISSNADEIIACVQSFPKKINEILGVDQWK